MKSTKKSPPRKVSPAPPRPPPPDPALMQQRGAGSTAMGTGAAGSPGKSRVSSPIVAPVGGHKQAHKYKPLIPVRPAPPLPTPIPMSQPEYNKSLAQAKSLSRGSNVFNRSAPTLGTITDSPSPISPHVSPFPQTTPGGTPVAAASAATSAGSSAGSSASPNSPTGSPAAKNIGSIDTGATPLSTTPGGSSTPIKLTMVGLKAAAAAQESAAQNLSTLKQQPPMASDVGGSAAIDAAARGVRSGTQVVGQQHQQVVVEMPGAPLQPPSEDAGTTPRSPGDLSQNSSNKATANTNQAETGNWAIYLFLGIFLLVLLVLIITLVITKQRK